MTNFGQIIWISERGEGISIMSKISIYVNNLKFQMSVLIIMYAQTHMYIWSTYIHI